MNKILQSYITEKKTGGNEDSGAGGPGGTFNCIGESEARAKVVAFISGQIKVNTHSSPNADSEQWIFELDGSFQEFVSSLQDGLQVKCNGTIQKP